jgi:hypothetical protein
LINNLFSVCIIPNLDPWINQQSDIHEKANTSSKFENQLLSIRDDRQKMIRPNCHPTYNERHKKIIEMIDWTLEKYKANMQNTQLNEEQVIIDDIIKQLDKKRNIAIHKMKQAMLKDEVSMYKLEEATLDYVLFKIRELTGSKLV